MNEYQPCRCCGKTYPFTADYFEKDASRKAGITRRCRQCAAAKSARYNREHPDKHRAACQRWRERHPERHQASARKYRQSAKGRATQQAYRQRHQARMDEQTRRCKRQQPEHYQVIQLAAYHRHRAKRRGLPDGLTADEWRACLSYWGGCCAVCGASEAISVDHWRPLASARSTGSVAANVLPLCQACNQRKRASDPAAWLTRQFGAAFAQTKLAEVEVYFRLVRGE